jgi:hypothetical protein
VTAFVVAAAVGIVGTVVGGPLSVFTEARNRRQAAKVAARMIFFELGVNLGVAGNMAYSTFWTRMLLHLSTPAEQLPDEWQKDCREAFQLLETLISSSATGHAVGEGAL